MKIRTNLKMTMTLVVLSIVILLISVLTVISIYIEYKKLKESHYNQLRNISADISRRMDFILEDELGSGAFIAGFPGLQKAFINKNGNEIKEVFTYWNESWGDIYNGLYYISFNPGPELLTASNDGMYKLKKDELFPEQNISEALNGNSAISSAFKSGLNGRPSLLVTVPVLLNKKPAGVICLVIDVTNEFASFVKDLIIGTDGYPFIIDDQGTILAHPLDSEVLRSYSGSSWLNKIREVKNGDVFITEMFGRTVMASVKKNDKYGYAAVATLPMRDIESAMKGLVVSMLAAGIIAIIILSLFVYKYLSWKFGLLTETRNAMISFEAGELNIRVRDSGIQDEIGVIASSLNEVLARIHNVISGIIERAHQLADYAKEINTATDTFSNNSQNQAAAAQEISATVDEMAAGMDSVAGSAREQFSMMEDLMKGIAGLSEIVTESTMIIKNTLNLTESIVERAQEGEQSLNEMNSNMTKITKSSEDMVNVVGIIRDISDQINLLSLNAAIEAARAGESGRGFAVVADEISKLADQTAHSIKEIENLIKSNNEDITESMNHVIKSIETISSVISGVESINGMMVKITGLAEKQVETNRDVATGAKTVMERADEIRIATDQQKTAIVEIVRSVSNVNDMTQTNASGAEELSASSGDISGMADSLRASVGYFRL